METIIERADALYADSKTGYVLNEFERKGYIKGAKEQKQIDIDKAINWLLENCFVDMGSHDTDIHFNSGYIHEFKKAMEE